MWKAMRYVLLFFAGFLSLCSNAQHSSYSFIPNRNQWQPDIDFISPIPGGKLLLSKGGFSYYLVSSGEEAAHHHSHQPDGRGAYPETFLKREHLVRVTFEGASSVAPNGGRKQSSYYNFYLGNDSSRWASEVYAYDDIFYKDLYQGIDLHMYTSGSNLKYDVMVDAGADPSRVSIRYEGAEQMRIDHGDLVISTSLGEIIEQHPYAYQYVGGKKKKVRCEFRLAGERLSFAFPEGYDACEPLVIDPLLIFSTYSGSTADNWGSTATPGEHGTLYSAGVTRQDLGGLFPTTPGAFQKQSGGSYDIGILKYDSTGKTLLYSTYLGGSEAESPHSLVVNQQNELIVLGSTSSLNYPVTAGVLSTTFNGGTAVGVIGIPYPNGSDIIVSRFNSNGTKLRASTYLGGTSNDGLNVNEGPLTRNYGDEMRGDVIVDRDESILVATVTSSPDFQNGVFRNQYLGGDTDGVVMRILPDLSGIVWGTFIGGSAVDAAYSIKIDASRNVYVAGGTTSADFAVATNAYQPNLQGNADGFVVKFSSDGSTMLHSTLTGTTAYDQIYFMDLDEFEEIYVYGQTTGSMPVTEDVYVNPNSGQFVQKFNNELTSLKFSTVFGSGNGTPDISPTAFMVNDCNNIYMTGWGGQINNFPAYWDAATSTANMPTSTDAFQRTTSGNDFYFLVLTDDAKSFLYGTYMGGTSSLTHVDGGTSRFDKSGVVYHAVCSGCLSGQATSSSDFPTTPGAWSRTNNSANCNNAAFKFDLASLRSVIQTNSVAYNSPGISQVCLPDPIRFQNKSVGGETYNWDLGDGTVIERTDSNSIVHRYAMPGTYTVQLTAVDLGTCQVKDISRTVVTVYASDMDVQDDDALCEGEQYTLQAYGGVSYRWLSADSTFQSNAAMPTVQPRDSMRYFVTVTDRNNCVIHDTVDLHVTPAIRPEFSIVRHAMCEGRSSISVQNTTDSLWAEDRLTFDMGDGTLVDATSVDHEYELDGLYNVSLIGERLGCINETVVPVPIFTVRIPNVITPNDDQKNQPFFIEYGKEHGPADYGFTVSLSIYNRWGILVYESADYRNDWDASGHPSGVYYFDLSIDQHAQCKSWLHVVR
jgi:hypothetical protein